MSLSKEQAVSLFGGVEPLRAALGLKSRSAIYMWPDDKPIPRNHELAIRYELKPLAFGKSGRLKKTAMSKGKSA